MKKIALILVLPVLALFFAVALSIEPSQSKRSTKLAEEFRNAGTDNLAGIVISPDQLSRESWRIELLGPDELEVFQRAAAQADARQVSGHSGPIGEWTLTLQFRSGKEAKYLASVHQYESGDLFLTDDFYVETGRGSFSRGNPRRARIPGLGPWILKNAPAGKLRSRGSTLRPTAKPSLILGLGLLLFLSGLLSKLASFRLCFRIVRATSGQENGLAFTDCWLNIRQFRLLKKLDDIAEFDPNMSIRRDAQRAMLLEALTLGLLVLGMVLMAVGA